MQLKGTQILMECLRREQVEIIFGYPGGAVFDIYEALSRTDIRHILVRHEQGAVHAADGYARASGRVGVCLLTSGPGATNAVTGIATAYMDSIPLVIITGQVATPLIGQDAFQEVNITDITRSCTKANFLVTDVRDIAPTIRRAFHSARSGRPRPVLVDLPRDVVNQSAEFLWPESVPSDPADRIAPPDAAQLEQVAQLLAAAQKPLIIIGGGLIIANACEQLTALAREGRIPVASSFMGLGGFPADDPLWLGMTGMHGVPAANAAASQADLILAVGTRFTARSTCEGYNFTPGATIVRIDMDADSAAKNIAVDIFIQAECGQALSGLRQLLHARGASPDRQAERAGWREHLARTAQASPLEYEKKSATIQPQRVIELLDTLTRGQNVLVATDVGQHQMWSGLYFRYTRPRTLLSSGGLGTMGFGLPAGMGAQLAHPDATVLVITGDGSLQMNIQELATMVENKLPLKIVLLNNNALGMVRQWQEYYYQKNYFATVGNLQPDFMKLADSYGVAGYRITDPALLESALGEALSAPGAALIEVVVEQEENVMPFVAPRPTSTT